MTKQKKRRQDRAFFVHEMLPKLADGTITPKERAVLARRCLNDFKHFCKLCQPPVYDWKTSQNELAGIITYRKRNADGMIRAMALAPRNAGKSTLALRYAAWRIARSAFSWKGEPHKNGAIRVLYVTETNKKATKNGKWMLALFTTSMVTKLFGPFRDRKKWTGEAFNIRQRKLAGPDPTWSTGSPETSTTGGHYDLLIEDDTVTESNTRTVHGMQKMRRYHEELTSQLDPMGENKVIGTRYHDNDLYGTIEREELPWFTRTFTVDDSHFPNLTDEFLAGKRLSLSKSKFAANYLNDPWAAEDRPFHENYIQFITEQDLPEQLNLFCLADIAGTESETSCQTAIWIIGLDCNDHLYLFHLVRGHWNPDRVVHEIAMEFKEWNPKHGVVENRVLTAWLQALLRSKEREFQIQLPFHKASGRGYVDKTNHIISNLQDRFASFKVWIVEGAMPLEEARRDTIDGQLVVSGNLVSDLKRFPRCQFLDALDGLAYVNALDENGRRLCKPPRRETAQSRVWKERDRQQRKSPWHVPSYRKRRAMARSRRAIL